MNLQADFKDGEVLFAELPPKPPDLRRYQGAMFLDRPDLWRPPLRRNWKAAPLPGQQPLFEEGDQQSPLPSILASNCFPKKI